MNTLGTATLSDTMPTIFDMDIGSDPDDTCVATIVLKAVDRFRPALLLTNDETSTFGRARFLARLVSAARLDIPVAAGLQSQRCRRSCLVEDANLCSPDSHFEPDGVQSLLRTLETHSSVRYFGLGALTNLDAALSARPDLADRVHLFQMGPALLGAYHRDQPQYNARLDPLAFIRVLSRVNRPTLVMSHSTWGTYPTSSRQRLGVYLDDPLAAALRAASAVSALFIRHLEAWVESGMPCTILHDPLTVLGSLMPGLLDFANVDLTLGQDGWAALSEASHCTLRQLLPDRARAISSYLSAPPPQLEGRKISCAMSLDTMDKNARQAIATALLGDTCSEVGLAWGAFNEARGE